MVHLLNIITCVVLLAFCSCRGTPKVEPAPEVNAPKSVSPLLERVAKILAGFQEIEILSQNMQGYHPFREECQKLQQSVVSIKNALLEFQTISSCEYEEQEGDLHKIWHQTCKQLTFLESKKSEFDALPPQEINNWVLIDPIVTQWLSARPEEDWTEEDWTEKKIALIRNAFLQEKDAYLLVLGIDQFPISSPGYIQKRMDAAYCIFNVYYYPDSRWRSVDISGTIASVKQALEFVRRNYRVRHFFDDTDARHIFFVEGDTKAYGWDVKAESLAKAIREGKSDEVAKTPLRINAYYAAPLFSTLYGYNGNPDKFTDIWPPLKVAIEAKRLNMVKLLVEKGANVHKTFTLGGITPLQLATEQQSAEIVEYLLEQGVCDLQPAFKIALEKGHVSIIKMLLAKGIILTPEGLNQAIASVSDETFVLELLQKGSPPAQMHLWTAVETQKIAVVKALITVGLPVDDAALLKAIATKNIELITLLLQQNPTLNRSHFSEAILADAPLVFEKLLAYDKQSLGSTHYDDIVKHAPSSGNQLLERLAENGIVPQMETFLAAIDKGQISFCEFFLKHLKVTTPALTRVFDAQNFKLFQLLVSKFESGPENQKTLEVLFLKAAKQADFEVVSLLLAHCVDVNTQAENGYTALMCAVNNTDSLMVKALLQREADTTLRAHSGETALSLLHEKTREHEVKTGEFATGFSEILNLLMKK